MTLVAALQRCVIDLDQPFRVWTCYVVEMPGAPQDQINALIDSLEDTLVEHWDALSRNAAVDVLQRLVDLTIIHTDRLSLKFRSPD